MRFKTSFLIGISSLLGAWFYVTEFTVKLSNTNIILKLSAVFTLLLCSSGSLNLLNDIIDLKIDKELKPERILPQGTVSVPKAYIFFAILTVICLICALGLNLFIVAIFLIMYLIGVFYSLFFQNIPLVKNFVVALSISMAILVGYLSLIVNLNVSFTGKIMVIFILSLFSIFSFELQKDINDVEVDKKFNKRTFPVIFGKKRSSIYIYVIYWLLASIFWLYIVFLLPSTNFYFVITLIGIQLYLLISVRHIVFDQSFEVLEKARIRIYALFAITLVFLFYLK